MPKKKKDTPNNVVGLFDKKTLKKISKRMPTQQPPPDVDDEHYKELLERIEESFWQAFADYHVPSEDAARMMTVMVMKIVQGKGSTLEDVLMAALMAKQLMDAADAEDTQLTE